MTRAILGCGLLAATVALAPAQSLLEGKFTRYYFDGPSAISAINWPRTHLFLLQRTPEVSRIQQSPIGLGTIEIPFSVVSTTATKTPAVLTLRLGLNQPPDPLIGTRVDGDLIGMLDADFSRSPTYLALLTLPDGKTWREVDLAVPRLLVPLGTKSAVKLSAGKTGNLASVFSALATVSKPYREVLAKWVYEVWRAEFTVYSEKYKPYFPTDPTISKLSGDPVHLQIGASALAAAKSANATGRTYLTLFAGMWGTPNRFAPFFASCKDPKTEADPDLLAKFVSDPHFPDVTITEALTLAKEFQPALQGVPFLFIKDARASSTADLKEMFFLSSGMRMEDRHEIYNLMASSLPYQLRQEFPEGFLPPYKTDGSTPHEQELREKWAAYLGIADPKKP